MAQALDPATERRPRLQRTAVGATPALVALTVAITFGTACTSDNGAEQLPSPTTSAREDAPDAADAGFRIEDLAISFNLPPGFSEAGDPGTTFLARSQQPPAIFSIDAADSDITDHQAREGERLSEVNVGAGSAVVVSDAAAEGLPPGIVANELLVSNGSRSFSVIMSARPADIDDLWREFIGSLVVADR